MNDTPDLEEKIRAELTELDFSGPYTDHDGIDKAIKAIRHLIDQEKSKAYQKGLNNEPL